MYLIERIIQIWFHGAQPARLWCDNGVLYPDVWSTQLKARLNDG